MKKLTLLTLMVVCLGLLSACDNKKATSESSDQLMETQTSSDSSPNSLKHSEILSVVAKESKYTEIDSMPYNSALTTGIIQGGSAETIETMALNIPKTWQALEGRAGNAYKLSKYAVDAAVDIWTVPPFLEDKEDKILGIKWLSSEEVVKEYCRQQGIKVDVFSKKIGQIDYSVATIDLPEANNTVVTYCAINDEGNFSSTAVITNVLVYDKIPVKSKLALLEEVEGMLATLNIK